MYLQRNHFFKEKDRPYPFSSMNIGPPTTLSKKITLVASIRIFFMNFPADAYVFNLDFIELFNT